MYENRRAVLSETPHAYFWQKKQIEAKPRFRRNSLCCVPWPSFSKTHCKRSRLEAHLPSRRLAGLEQQRWLPGHSTCSCRRQDAARSWREIPGSGSPQDPLPRRRRSERAGARDLPVRGVTAALAGGGFKRRALRSAGGSAPPSPFWMSHWRTLIGWKWRISNWSQNVCFRRLWMKEYYHTGWRARESGWLSCKFKLKEVCLKLSKISNFWSRFRVIAMNNNETFIMFFFLSFSFHMIKVLGPNLQKFLR